MSPVKKSTNKSTIFIFITAFILPVILAKVALDNNWFNQAATNKGELIQPALDMTSLQGGSKEPKWKLLYVLPEQCKEACENALYSVAQVHSALGKESDRAEVVVLAYDQSDSEQLALIKEQPNYRLLNTNLDSLNQVFDGASTQGVFIVDTLNNIILRYPLYINPEDAILHSRDILSDMRKVLKLSRIG
ncbi:hypothetical protein [Paraglaciecola marina]|uniref:hypothetical protein n=1 Tax=Paraglaciecola marina TaxID=2500157 RepID=UPI00105BCFB4|nr:hypothetical protein [Paraglaciecola marina]